MPKAVGLAQDLKKEAEKVGFAVAGISNPDVLRGLPYGKIDYVCVLKTPEEELPKVRSVILMGIYAWDAARACNTHSGTCAVK